MMPLNKLLTSIEIVPVISINDADKAVKLAEVLIDNGLPCAEITFRTPQAAQAIKNIRKAYPQMLIGAGTILTLAQVDEAIEAGSDFIVSPGFNPSVVRYCQQKNFPMIPGVNTPSLVEQAMAMGVDTVKFFPAEPSGGIAMLKAMSAVYPVNFMPTGGINPSNVRNYLELKSVVACGGTWMVPNDLIENEEWDKLAELVKETVNI